MKVNFIKIKTSIIAACLLTTMFFSSCKKEEETSRLVIWTSCTEFAQYIELFNRNHPDCQAILVYKDNPALSLPPAKDEIAPDIIVGPWLRSDKIKNNFRSLDYLFDRRNLSSSLFYPQLLNTGKIKNTQYLLPVSFNLPCIIFADENKNLLPDNYTLTMQQLRKTASEFNSISRSGTYKKMGFSVLNNPDFLYTSSKLNNVNFHDEDGNILWNEQKLNATIASLKDWINTENKSAQTENDFAYKYLFMPDYRQVTSGKTLFAYTTSDRLFQILHEQDLNIDYRWITDGTSIPVEDDFIMMGISKKTQNLANASEFITWFFRPENQDAILDRKIKLHLNTEMFGISGGFSSVREVTEKIIPIYYTQLLSNLPPQQMISPSPQVPARWQSYKSIVILPYLESALNSEKEEDILSIDELEKEWRKKVFD